MKISTLMHGTTVDLEERKRALQRRDAGEAYKRTSKFVEASKNPLLAALENLLSGKTDKELHEADKALPQSVKEQLNTFIRPESSNKSDELQKETVSLKDFLTQADLSSVQSTPQVAEKTNVQNMVDELQAEAPFADEPFNIQIPERFEQMPERNTEQPTVFGRDLEQHMFQLAFNRAMNKYASHVAMVKNGYKPYVEPSFSQIA